MRKTIRTRNATKEQGVRYGKKEEEEEEGEEENISIAANVKCERCMNGRFGDRREK